MARLAHGARAHRLLWIHQNFVTARQAGNSRAVHFISRLLAEGWEVDIVCGQVTYMGRSEGASAEPAIEREGGLTIHRLPVARGYSAVHSRARFHAEFALRALLYARRLEPCDVVFASSPPLPLLLPSLWLSAHRRAPFMLEIRDLWPAFLLDGGMLRDGPLLRAFEWLEAATYRYATHCTVVAPAFRPYVQEMGIDRAQISVAPTGVPRDIGRADGGSWRERHGLNDEVVFLYAGSFNEAHGLELLLEAVEIARRQRPDIVWVFAGEGRKRAQIEAAARESTRVRYIGAIPKDDLLEVFAAADVGVVCLAPWALLDTVVPGKLLDYLAAALPVLSVVDGQVGAILRAAAAGFVVAPRTREALAAEILRIASMTPDERRATGLRGRAWARQHMEAESSAWTSLRAVTQLLESQPPAAGIRRLARAGAGAIGDVWRSRSRRALAALYGDARQDTVESEFRAWLGEARLEQGPTCAVPAILSRQSAQGE